MVTAHKETPHVEDPACVSAARGARPGAGVLFPGARGADRDHHFHDAAARDAAHPAAAGHRRRPVDAVRLCDPGDRAGAAHVHRHGSARRAHAVQLRNHLGDRARRRLLSHRSHGHQRDGQCQRDADARVGHDAAPDAAAGLEQLRFLRRQHQGHRGGGAGASVEDDAAALWLEPGGHRLPLVRSRRRARRQRPLPAVDVEVPVGGGWRRVQVSR